MLSMDRSTTGLNVRFLSVRSLLARPQWQVDGQYFQPAGDPASSTCTIARGYWRENRRMTDGRRVPPRTARTQFSPHPHLAGARIGQELDFSDPLLQLKHRDAASDQRISVDRWPDTPRASIEMPNPEHPFKIADHFGYGGCFTRNCAAASDCTTAKNTWRSRNRRRGQMAHISPGVVR